MEFKDLYGMDYDQYMGLMSEAEAKDPELMGFAKAQNMRAGLGESGVWGGGSYGELPSDPRSNIALYNAVKAGDKRLYGSDGARNMAPEIEDVSVMGPMTAQMRAAKGGRWEQTGTFVNPASQGLMGNQMRDRGETVDPMIERWTYRADPVAQVQQHQAPIADDPKPDGPTIYDGWDEYTGIARAETEGMNRMPFVGPNWQTGNPTYADIPYNPELSLEMFYKKDDNAWREKLRDPLEGALLKKIA